MNNHYYSKNPNIDHEEKDWNFELLGNNLHFTTDNGVFSKRRVDFGTVTLLNAISKFDLGEHILDVGCGYGPIGIAIAKKNPKANVDMIDVNLLALELAKKNVKANLLENVTVFNSNVYENVSRKDYNAVITNPPIRVGKKIVHEILGESVNYLKKQGSIFAVLQKKQGAKSAQSKLKEVFGNCKVIAKNKGYYIMQSIKK